MLIRIIKHEWHILLADYTTLAIVLLFGVVIGYASYTGHYWVKKQQQNIEQMQVDEQKRLAEIGQEIEEEEAKLKAQGKTDQYPDWGARHPFYVGAYRGQRYAALTPSALSQLAIGQSDVYPKHFKVSVGMKESFMLNEDTESPFKLFAGYFDIAFVILYLYPLIILTLSFNLTASEKEDGTLAMLLSNAVSLKKIILGKVILRALMVFLLVLSFSVVGIILSETGSNFSDLMLRLLLWTLAVIVYGSFWFALAVVINSFGKASSWNATVLASCWLVLIVIIPASINLSATSFYPVPSRIEFVTAMRRESRQAELEGSRLLGKYFQDHPELAERKNELDSNKDDFAMLQLAKDDMVARQLEPVLRDFDSQLVSQNKLVNSFRFFSPAILMQAVLYDISGTGVVRYQSFIKQVEAFHTTWHNFFSSRIFEKRSLTRDDIKKFPTFTYDDETVSEIFGRVMTPILILLVTTIIIGSFGFNRYKNYSVAGY